MPRKPIRSLKSASRLLLPIAIACVTMTAHGQTREAGPAGYPAQTAFPRENAKAVAVHLSAARRLAEPDLEPEFYWRCLTSPLDRQSVFAIQHNGLVVPTKVFDNLYSVGQNAVSAWALDTDQGIILIDALNNTEEARDIIVPNLKALGLDPARIKYVIVTHGHGDHYGGAKYIQETFGARVVASAADWEMMEHPGPGPFAGLAPPKRDIVAKDDDRVTLGSTSVHLYVTPGHTPGVLSLIFPVSEKGVHHVAGLMGGSGGGQDSAAVHQQIRSLERWQALTRAAKVDVNITNHPSHMSANEKLALIRDGVPGDANPFIYGSRRYQRFVQVINECSRVQLARMGENGSD
jgi:metallo-beta-lactamase class B